MKKIIISSICTLALSLFGTLGANQINNSYDDESKNTSNIESAEQQVEDVDGQVTSTDKEITVTNETQKSNVDQDVVSANSDTDDYKDVDTTQQINTKASTEVTEQKENKNTKVNEAPKTNVEVANKNTATTGSQNRAIPVKTNNNETTSQVAGNYINSGKGPVLVYKNVDLSQCNSTNEVVRELQKNGIKNINLNNINNVQSLEEILNYIQSSNQNVQQPTAKPSVPTAKPSAPTTKPSAPTSAPTNNSGISSYANQVLQLVNQERAKAGLSSLTTNTALTAAANKRAEETKVSFSHTRPNGTSFSTALKEFNVPFQAAGENIAYGQRTPQEVVTGWMNSPGHRANILNAKFGKIGIGVYSSNGVIYWSQLFTN